MEDKEIINKIEKIINRTSAINTEIKFSEYEEIYRICSDGVDLVDIETEVVRDLSYEEIDTYLLNEILFIAENAEVDFNKTLKRCLF